MPKSPFATLTGAAWRGLTAPAFLLCLLSWSTPGAAQEADTEEDRVAVIETGAGVEHGSQGGSSRVGGAVGIEFTPIEHWLEIEFGFAAMHASGSTELSGDLVFKKPFRLSPSSELMIGVGPFISRTVSGTPKDTTHGVEVALDFMHWSAKDGGWYVEPSWSRTSGSGERTVGLTVGLLFGLP